MQDNTPSASFVPDTPEGLAIPFHFAEQHGIFTYPSSGSIEGTLVLSAMCRVDVRPLAMAEVNRWVDQPLIFEFVDDLTFQAALVQHYQAGIGTLDASLEGIDVELDLDQLASTLHQNTDLLNQEDDAPIIRVLNAIFKQAIQRNASDIHIQSFANELSIRYRIDGILRDVLSPPRELAPLLVSRVKIIAGLNIAEKRLPQDGRASLRLAGHVVDLRVSTMPTQHGERVVLRLLDKQTTALDLDTVGILSGDLAPMKRVFERPSGIILVTGPTGSGKTTTLYAALNHLNNGTRNILTIEDPVEYDLAGVGQTQVSEKAGMTFAKSLRAMLRQDPDVVMVGEIRDKETAEIAIQSSLTGHMVLSTLHTNTAVGAVTRLIDLGIEGYLIASSLSAVLAQRLVRRLCDVCKATEQVNHEQAEQFGLTLGSQIYCATGCAACHETGYRGRKAIYEWIVLNDTSRRLIHEGASESELERYLRTQSTSMYQNGLARIASGETTLEELLRVSTVDEHVQS